MRSLKPNLRAMLWLALISTVLTGCASAPSSAPLHTLQCPKPTPLPAAVLQIDLQPSTASLSPALEWSQRSEEILDGVTPK